MKVVRQSRFVRILELRKVNFAHQCSDKKWRRLFNSRGVVCWPTCRQSVYVSEVLNFPAHPWSIVGVCLWGVELINTTLHLTINIARECLCVIVAFITFNFSHHMHVLPGGPPLVFRHGMNTFQSEHHMLPCWMYCLVSLKRCRDSNQLCLIKISRPEWQRILLSDALLTCIIFLVRNTLTWLGF